MNAARWQSVRDAFEVASGHEPEEWPRLLESLCPEDPELREEVASLLASERAAGSFLALAADLAEDGEAHDPLIGRSLGPYRLVRRLGGGGMGVVYLAVRADSEFRKRVAVKVLKPGMDSEEVVRRFRTERQILAALDHPHIARLLDGGTTDRGLPYFVLEYVEGEPITGYCEARGLPIRERLELFRTVCAAVQFAHQNLVVHRDLKPANILVTADGTPKLLDFGIAKLLNPELSGATVVPTLAGWRPMTPDYASPEQIRGERVTTASDTYSLGVLLYELLTGRSPHAGAPPELAERARWICDHVPPRPSDAVAGRDDGGRLRRALAGDLDQIALKALARDPARRYTSPEQLSEDLGRYLVGLPVRARRGTLTYRAGKLLRRHRLAAAVAATLLLAVLAFGTAMGFLAAQLARERDRAELERRRAEEVTAFLVGLFQVSDPGRATGQTVTAREILDEGARRLGSELDDQPAVRADLQSTIGTIYRRLGLLDRAAGALEAALEGRRRLLGPEHPKVAETLNELAIVLQDRGELERAEALYREALDMRRRLLGPEHPDVAQSQSDLGGVRWARGDLAGAEVRFRESLAMRRRLFGADHPDVAKSLNNLAIVLWAQGRYGQAEERFREALRLRRRFLGDEHVEVADALNNLAIVVQAQDRDEEAEALYREALAMRLKLLGQEHPLVADSLNNVGYALQGRGEYAEAEGFHREALALRTKLLGDDHPAVAQSLFNLGVVAQGLGDLEAAESRHREALKLRRRAYDEDHPEVAASLDGLGQVLLDAGRPEEAREALGQALELRRLKLGEDHPDTSSTRRALARLGGPPLLSGTLGYSGVVPERNPIVVVDRRIAPAELARLTALFFEDMVKYVVDLERRVAAVGGELHADAEALLLEAGSDQKNLWGANYYPGQGEKGCIEYTSLINIRPGQGNRSMEVEDPRLREQIRELTFDLIGRGEPLP